MRNEDHTTKSVISEVQDKRKLKRVDWEIVKRIVTFLYHNGKIKKTSMAMQCTMGYDRCVLYLNWLDRTGLIKKHYENGYELISLSDKGVDFYNLLTDSIIDFS